MKQTRWQACYAELQHWLSYFINDTAALPERCCSSRCFQQLFTLHSGR